MALNQTDIDFDRLMNLVVITVIKKRFLRSNKEYIIYVLYTPNRKQIYKVNTDYDKFPYNKGDHIDKVINWCEDNNYEFRKRRGKSSIWD